MNTREWLHFMSDEELTTYAEIIQQEQDWRVAVKKVNRRLNSIKILMNKSNLHFINAETGEVIEDITIG